MRPGGAFTDLLLLLLSAASAVIVPAPANVSVFCSNLQIKVNWTYDDKQTDFNVTIQGSEGMYDSVTRAHEYDLTHYVWQSDHHYLDFMDVTVTAVQGGSHSHPVATPSFTFNALKKAHVTCSLDFPPVDVKDSEQTSITSITFLNPFHFYRELESSERRRDAFFKFTVFSEQGEVQGESECPSTQRICRYDLETADAVKTCVTLRGRLDYGNNVEHVTFKETELICAEPDSHVAMIAVLVTVVVLAVAAVAAVTISICAVKAWTLKPVPKPTVPHLVLPNSTRGRLFFQATGEEIHPVTVVVPVSRSPSVCAADGEDVQDSDGGGAAAGGGSANVSGGGGGSGVDLRPRGFGSFYTDGKFLEDSGQDLETLGLMSTGHGTDEDSADDSVRTECFVMEEGEEPGDQGEEPEDQGEEPNTDRLPDESRNHYDRPHIS